MAAADQKKGKVQEGERLLPFFLGGVQGKERPRRPEFAGKHGNGAALTRPRWLKRTSSSTQLPSFLRQPSSLRI
jgi:hypothetical protein